MKRAKTGRALLALLLVLTVGFTFTMPVNAEALTTSKLTAKPNSDKGNEVLGGKTTRLTWEGAPASGETITQITFTLPSGTGFSASDTKAEKIESALATKPSSVDATITAEGQKLVVKMASGAVEDGGYLRVMIGGVTFPVEGGSFVLTAEYTTSAGNTVSLGALPEVNVTASTWAQGAADWLNDQPAVQAWNSVTFLNLFFNPSIAVRALPSVLLGFFMAIAVVALAFPCAIPIGLLLALMRMSKRRLLRGLAGLYVNVVRGTPLFLQIYIVFFGLPLAGVNIPSYAMAVIVLSLNSGAYVCEILRAGIQSIPKGQFEASRSLGMNGAQTMAFVIIPQTVRRVIPTLTSEFILLYKDTSLLASVGFMEIIMYSKAMSATTGSITPYVVAALFYLLLTIPLTKLVGNLEARLADGDNGTSVQRLSRKERKAAKQAAKQAKANAKRAGESSVVPAALADNPVSETADSASARIDSTKMSSM